MYHYLGIVAEDDYQKGIIIPSYILCKSYGKSEARSGWRVVKQNKDSPLLNMPKVLVRSMLDHDDMIEFLSRYNTRDHIHGSEKYSHEETMKYYPEGAMFWFSCNEYGEPGSYALFIKKVPDGKCVTSSFQKLKESRSRKIPIKDVFLKDKHFIENENSCVKPKLVQRK